MFVEEEFFNQVITEKKKPGGRQESKTIPTRKEKGSTVDWTFFKVVCKLHRVRDQYRAIFREDYDRSANDGSLRTSIAPIPLLVIL